MSTINPFIGKNSTSIITNTMIPLVTALVDNITTSMSPLTTGDPSTTTSTSNQSSTTIIPTSTFSPTIVPASNITFPSICKQVLYSEMGSSRIRWWDFMIFIPNLAFALFLLLRFQVTRAKLLGPNTGQSSRSNQRSSPIMFTFYMLIVLCVVTSLLRCIISMALDSTTLNGEDTDKLFWILDRFFLLSTEISVVVFGLAFGHLDSRTSIKRVLLVTSLISLVYSTIQGTLEFTSPDERYYIHDPTRTSGPDIALFSHGGTVFWSVTCMIFSITYLVIATLPLISSQSSTTFNLCLFINIRTRVTLPSRRSFYAYCYVLSILNLVQAIGSIMFYHDLVNGLCMINVTTFTYFSFFIPFIYYSFLSDYFKINPSTMLYKHFNENDGYINDLIVEDENYPTQSSSGINNMSIPAVSYAGINYRGPNFEFTGETSVLTLKTTDVNREEGVNHRESVLSQISTDDVEQRNGTEHSIGSESDLWASPRT